MCNRNPRYGWGAAIADGAVANAAAVGVEAAVADVKGEAAAPAGEAM